jgi:hypothetical protein
LHSLAPEILELQSKHPQARGVGLPLALEERRIFSIHIELRLAMYVAVAAIVGGVGLLIHRNLDRIGPVALTTGILLAAALSYFLALRRRPRGLAGDYLLLLGALLLGIAVGYAESQFHLLGAKWTLHLVLLALLHAATAYAFDSRLVLLVALTCFAAWIGLEPGFGELFVMQPSRFALGWRSLAVAGVCAVAWSAHRFAGGRLALGRVYEQFGGNFAFFGALSLAYAPSTRLFGMALLLALCVAALKLGLRWKRESFVLYAIGYGTVGLVSLEGLMLRDPLLVSNVGLLTVIGAVLLLLKLRGRLKEASS